MSSAIKVLKCEEAFGKDMQCIIDAKKRKERPCVYVVNAYDFCCHMRSITSTTTSSYKRATITMSASVN